MRAGCPIEVPVMDPGQLRVMIWVVGPEEGTAAVAWRVSNHLLMAAGARELFVGMQMWPEMTDPAAGRVVRVRRQFGARTHAERSSVIFAVEREFGAEAAGDVRHVLWAGLPGTRGDAFDALGRLLDSDHTVGWKPSLGGNPFTATRAPSGRVVEVHWTTIGPATGPDWGSFWEDAGLGDEA